MYELVFDKNGNVIGYITPKRYERKIVLGKDGRVIGYYIPSVGLVLGVNGGVIGCDSPYPPFYNEDKHRH